MGKPQSGAGTGRRMYTVLPPPADYKADPETSAPLPEPDDIKNGEDAAGKTTTIFHLCTLDVHHRTRRDLQREVSPG